MATYNYDNPTRTLSVVFTATEATTVVRAAQVYGGRVLANYIDTWIANHAAKFNESDQTAFKSALLAATPAQIAQIKTILGLA